jgi:hypothetical protein
LIAAGAGNYLRRRKERRHKREYMRSLDLLIFQVPAVGQSPEVLNKIFETVKSYKSLPIRVETWVVIEHADQPSKYYPHADRVIVVPKGFKCYAKAKARALEYARRYRQFLVEIKQIPEKYLIVQGDDDGIPSEELLYESLFLDIDLISAMILPRSDSGSRITRITDHQRLYACTCSCMFAINAGIPVCGDTGKPCYTPTKLTAREAADKARLQSIIMKEKQNQRVCVLAQCHFPLPYISPCAIYMGSNGGVEQEHTQLRLVTRIKGC